MAAVKLLYWILMLFLIPPIAYLGIMLPLYSLYVFGFPKLFLKLEKLFATYHNKLMGVIAVSGGFEITDYGADVAFLGSKRCLVMANHQTHADHFPLLATFQTKGRANTNPLWLIYKFFALRWSPLGIAWSLHGNYFVSVGNRLKEMAKLTDHLENVYWKHEMGWIFLYPEGAILPKYKHKSQQFAKKNGHPHLECLSLPRTAALKTILDSNEENGSEIEHIIDVTVGYPEGVAPTILELFAGFAKPLKTGIYYRVYKVSELKSLYEDDLRKWLYERWMEKEELLEEFHKRGTFPGKGTPVVYDGFESLFLQICWVALSLIVVCFGAGVLHCACMLIA